MRYVFYKSAGTTRILDGRLDFAVFECIIAETHRSQQVRRISE
jgi:hypothetical protein